MTKMELRIQRELMHFNKEKSLLGMTLSPDPNDIHHLTATIPGPDSSPYHHGVFHIDITLTGLISYSLTLCFILRILNPSSVEAQAKAELNKKAHSAVILCLVKRKAKIKSHEVEDSRAYIFIQSEDPEAETALRIIARKVLLDWIMDSGGSYHMTPMLDLFYDFLECDEGMILLGDNMECKIRGIGKVRVQLKDGSSFVLHNVRYIPELKRNLISLGTLKKEGYTVKMQSGKIKVINGSRVVLSETRRDNCVYSWMAIAALEVELMLVLKKKTVLPRFGIKDWDISARQDYKCWKSKAHYSKSDRLCSSDLLGSVLSGNNWWFKHEAFGKFKEWKQLVENQTGRTVKKLRTDNGLEFCNRDLDCPRPSGRKRHVRPHMRTDNGLEFCNREFEQLCIESGIARHLTVAGTPQQNGVAERMNRTLMDKSGNAFFWGDKSVEKLQVEVELQRLNNHTTKEDQIDQGDGDDEDAGDHENDQTPDLTDYQLARDRERRTRTKPLRTWVLVDHPAGQKLVSCKWLFKIKEGIEGVQRPRYKERLVARGFTQRACIDYNEVFLLVVRHTSIRVILALTACKDYELEQLDVKTAFLHGNLEEVIYMRQPPGYEQGNKVCLLKKSRYGLKQSPRQWYRMFDEYMLSNGFKRSSYNSCVYYRSYAPGEYIYLLLYVDDMLIACKSKAKIGFTKTLLKREFDMKELGEAKKILGMEIIRDRSRKILRVSQSGYVSKILNNFRIDNGKSVQMPLGGHFKLSLKDCPVRDCDVEKDEPDIAYAVSIVSRYLANPGKNHWEAVKWILKYLRGTANVGLVYGTNRDNHVDVIGFVDSEYAKDPDKEAEYMALTEAVKEAIWLRGLLRELGVELNKVAVNYDNQGAIHLSRNHVFHERTKHINVRYHFIREVLEAKTVEVLKVDIEHNVADALTKVVPGHKLQHCLELLSVGIG
ncbi:retrotransposon protein, putative, ty1-copia subclass [Tanacetum coccineum]